MGISVTTDPRALDFFAVSPGDARKHVLLVAPSSAKVTARIDGGSGRFRIDRVACQRVWEQRLTPEEIDLLPPHMQNDPRYHVSVERAVVGSSDGVTPLDVEYTNEVVVDVTYRGEDTGAGVDSATLAIHGTGWDPISVPVAAIVGEVELALSSSHVTVRQGAAVELTATLKSIAGPDTDVVLALERSPEYWTLEPASVRLARRATVAVPLRVVAGQNTPAGTYDAGLTYTPFGNPRNSTKVPFRITVTAGAVAVRLLDPHVRVMQGGTAVCRVEATSEGGTKQLRLQPGGLLPAGVSMRAEPKLLDSRTGPSVVPIELSAARDAPPVADAFTPIQWSAADRVNEGLLAARTTVVVVPEERTFRHTITTPSGTALGGWVELTIRNDGTSTFRGHMHGSGFDPYTFRVSVTVRSSSGWLAVAALKSGKVGGTLDSTSRSCDWTEDEREPNSLIRSHWREFRDGTLSVNKQYENVGVLGSVEDIARVLVEFVLVSAVASPQAAAVIVLGSELAARAGVAAPPPGLLAGMVVAGGVVWMFGPGVLLPAVAAGLVTAGQFRSRPLREEETRVANLVFKGTLPVDRILITNLDRDHRGFCVPYGRWIVIGIGGHNDGAVDMYDDALKQPEWRKLLIHELTHAWQIERRPDHELLWEAAANEGRNRGDVYHVGQFDGRAWGDYGLEPQAEIVERWFASADHRLNARQIDSLDDDQAKLDPYFVYIQNNIRLGQL